MKKRITRLFCLLFCLILCLGCIPACQKADPLSQNGIRSVNIIKKERVEILVTLNSSLLKEHKGERICLYELFPGETVADLSDKAPVAEKKAKASVNFRIPLEENGIDRLYSSFVVAFSDGTLISQKTFGVKNPEFLATEERQFPWVGTPKGLITSNAEDAWSMGASHTVIPLRLSELLNGTDTTRFNDDQYLYSAAVLKVLDDQIFRASSTGMQVSVELILDNIPSLGTAAAMLDLLNGRYASDSDYGFVSAWMISPEENIDAQTAAEVAHLAQLALRSHYSNGRIFLLCGGKTYTKTADFFSVASQSLSELGVFEWGAVVRPSCEKAPWEGSEEDMMTVDQIPALFKFLAGDQILCKPSYLAVSGLSFSSSDREKQAASIAYSYQLSVASGATMVFYDDGNSELFGLLDENGDQTPASRVFETMDLGLSGEDSAMVESLSHGGYSKITQSLSRKELTGTATVGSDGQKNTILYDFSGKDTHGFSAVGGLSAPSCEESVSMGRPVLYTWLSAESAAEGEGVRKILPNGQALENAFSISLRMLLQNLETPTSRVTLRLDGISKNGSQRITFEASAELENDSRWQTAIFYIGSFVAEADLSQPCVMTLYTDTSAPKDTEYLLWLDSVDIRKPEKQLSEVVYLAIALGAVVIGFLLIFLIYRLTSRKRPARKAKYRR